MGEWIDFDRWSDCKQLEKPGMVFEVTNGQQSLFTSCVVPLQTPSDWTAPPVRFRLVPASPPRHSSPIPKPQGRP
jgi:hypothetical protein